MMAAVGDSIAGALKDLKGKGRDAIKKHRREKFLAIGRHIPS
jgi:acetyl-CoA carboxylase carboxyl transferase subunit alpha